MSDQDYFLNLSPIPVHQIENDAKRAMEVAKSYYRRKNVRYSSKLAQQLAVVYGIDTDDGIKAIDSSLCDIAMLDRAEDYYLDLAVFRLAANLDRLRAGEPVFGHRSHVPTDWVVAKVDRAYESTCSLGNTSTVIHWRLLSGDLAGRTYSQNGKRSTAEEAYTICTGLRGSRQYRCPSQLSGMLATLRIVWWDPDLECSGITVAKWMRDANTELADAWHPKARSKAKRVKRQQAGKSGSTS